MALSYQEHSPPGCWPFLPYFAYRHRVNAPAPKLIVTSGSRLVVPCLALRQQAGLAIGEPVGAVYILKPPAYASAFDAIVSQAHDQMTGGNLVTTTGALSVASADRLAATTTEAFAEMPRPWTALLLGGPSKAVSLEGFMQLAEQVQRLQARLGEGSLLICPSRRTPEAFLDSIETNEQNKVWRDHSTAPYMALLAHADQLVTTADSINMISEAASVAKERGLYVLHRKTSNAKFERFYAAMTAAGHMRWFEGSLNPWRAEPYVELEMAAEAVRERLIARGIDL